MRLLFVGDIVGKPGRRIVAEKLNTVVYQHHIDLVIVNCENAAAGFGVTPAIA
jgi:calcineurin-like phosphoesterase